jgi:hypothetical protein
MKRTLLALALVAALPASAATAGDYSGTWRLSKEKSKDLPSPMYDKVKSTSIVVTQRDQAFNVDVTVEAEGRPQLKQSFRYPLDGTTNEIETTVRTPDGPMQVPTTLEAKQREGALELVETRNVNFGERQATFTSSELWTLSDDGKTLTVHRKDQRPQGPLEYDMVFVRD